VLVASEWYLSSDGLKAPAQFNMDKAHARMPDWMTFNGYVGQYVAHPLVADPGQLVRFWVVDAGPSLDTDFHIVGTVLNKAYPFADMTPAHTLSDADRHGSGGWGWSLRREDRQARAIPLRFTCVRGCRRGQVGLLNMGHVHGTMSH
jgi:nitrite reductase (NO-forming)